MYGEACSAVPCTKRKIDSFKDRNMKKYYSLLYFGCSRSKCAEIAKTLQIFGLKKHILAFNQSAYNKEWLGGGTSNIAGILA
jgi:hypothetical protein